MNGIITAEILRAWASRLCSARSSAPADLAAVLGVALDVPSPGITRARARGGDIPLVELDLADPLPLGDFDRLLGTGNRLPRVDWDRPHVIAYTIEVPRAPYRCALLASCDQPPSANAPVARVSFRLDRV